MCQTSACSWHLEGYCGWRSLLPIILCLFVWIRKKPALQVDSSLAGAQQSHKEASPSWQRQFQPRTHGFWSIFEPQLYFLTSYSCVVNNLLFSRSVKKSQFNSSVPWRETFNSLTTIWAADCDLHTHKKPHGLMYRQRSKSAKVWGGLGTGRHQVCGFLNTLPTCLRFWVE